MKPLRAYGLFLVIIVFDAVLWAINPSTGKQIFHNTYLNFVQMLSVLPPIFLLLGLLDVWVPRQTIIRYLGDRSGIVGIALSIFLGAAAAGPLYGAFPIAAVMAKKGAKYSNILVFLGAWSTLKIPMFLFEISYLGINFAVTRWLVNVPGVVLMAFVIDKLLKPEEKVVISLGEEHVPVNVSDKTQTDNA